MKKAILFFSLLALSIFTVFFISHDEEKYEYPVPTNGTMVKTDMEEKNLSTTKEKWIEAMHRAAPGVDWRELEYRTSMDRQNNRTTADTRSRNGEVSIADDLLKGEWIERGSNNQAGSVFDMDYDVETNELYLVSSGGSIFKTDYYLQYWEVVNDRFKFTHGLLKLLKLPNGNKRLVALIGNEPHYSDDLGLTWTSANAYNADNWGHVKDAFVTQFQDQDVILILAKTGYWSDYKLYMSTDQGASYQSIHHFYTSDGKNLAMTHIEKSGEIYLIEQIDANRSRFFRFDFTTMSLDQLNGNSPHGFGSDGTGNLAGVQIGTDTLKFLSYNGNNELYTSLDTGTTWTYLSTLPIRPWEVRLFVSAHNPNLVLIGAVECYRSLNGGKNWQLINGWAEYYGDVEGKLHADIMQFDEFFDQDGNHFVTISNHGGVSASYDNTITNTNIGLFDLNVSQYYSVRTSPDNPEFIMAGSQDQGLQRGFLRSKNTANLEQVISGDYGHNVFTKGGQAFWTVYPGGWVSHYSNPKLGYLDDGWEVNSDNETVWIPPLVAGPDPDKDEVILAGGSLDGGPGSFLIKLSYNFGIQKEQLPFDFKQASESEISAIGISPINPENWYVATNNGHFYYSIDGGQHFEEASNYVPGAHYLYGACILPSKLDDQTLYLSGSGYSTAGVVKSTDGGKSFISMDNGLPGTMVFAITANEDESMLFAATEAGPFVYIREDDRWYDLAGDVAPTQSYWSVEYIATTQTVRFGTYGRGIWDFNIEDTGVGTDNIYEVTHSFNVFPNPVLDRMTIVLDNSIEVDAKLAIFNMQGKRVIEESWRPNSSRMSLDVSHLPAGSYITKIAGNGMQYSGKFIKN